VVTRPRRLEFDLIELVNARHLYHRTHAALRQSCLYIGYITVSRSMAHPRVNRSTGLAGSSACATGGHVRARPRIPCAAHAGLRHAAGSQWAATTPGATWPPGQKASGASWRAPPRATAPERHVLLSYRNPGPPRAPTVRRPPARAPAGAVARAAPAAPAEVAAAAGRR